MLVTAAKVIAGRRSELRGTVVVLFQPAEERHSVNNPLGGAIRMIRDHAAGAELSELLTGGAAGKAPPGEGKWTTDQLHLTDGFETEMDGCLLEHVDEVYGAHLWNYASAGTIGCSPGSVTANSDSLEIVVTGTGGHASAPHGKTPVQICSRRMVGRESTL
jgi:metal-dependent amidase/aminoacylase/carboxypeptidase family protein